MRPSPTPETPEADAPGARASWLGLRLPFEIVVRPASAFAGLVARPEWFVAFILVVLAGWANIALIAPALEHLLEILRPPVGFAGRPPAELSGDLRDYFSGLAISQTVSTLFQIGLASTTLAVVARFKRCTTPVGVYVALSANCLIPSAIGAVASGLVTAARPPASFHDIRGLLIALPDNLALFADPAHTSEALFLGSFDLFTLWSTILLAYGFVAVTPVRFSTALVLSFGLTLAASASSLIL